MTDQASGEWRVDPSGAHELRWWDGAQWTDNVSDGGESSTDPLSAPPAATADRWEYHVVQYNMSDRWSQKRQAKELEAFNVRLNMLGAQGWEMISYESVPLTGAFTNNVKGYAYLTFFKRRLGTR